METIDDRNRSAQQYLQKILNFPIEDVTLIHGVILNITHARKVSLTEHHVREAFLLICDPILNFIKTLPQPIPPTVKGDTLQLPFPPTETK